MKNHIFYKRINSERFLFVAKIEDIEKMKKGNFEFLTRVRNIAEKNDLALTISMGISYGEESLETIGEVAQNNLDIALVRGGDQVVLKKADEEAKNHSFLGEYRWYAQENSCSLSGYEYYIKKKYLLIIKGIYHGTQVPWIWML